MVGWPIPISLLVIGRLKYDEYINLPTLYHFLSSVNLCDLVFEKFVTPLTNCHNFLTSYAQGSNSFQDLLRNLRSILVFGEGIRVVERVIYNIKID